MTDLQQLSTSELTQRREELATRYPAGHNKARRLNEQIAAIDAVLAGRTEKATTQPPRLTYRERRERRAARRRSWAEGREAKATAASDSAQETLSLIPPGQPILVGHHSERRHRRNLERADNNMRKASEHSQMARRHTEAADTIERQLDVSIYDDDPDAIDKLRIRIVEREAKRERIKQYNRNRRKGSKTLEPLNEEEQRELATTARVASYQLGPKGQAPAYWLTNLGGSIKRDKDRLARLESAAGEEAH